MSSGLVARFKARPTRPAISTRVRPTESSSSWHTSRIARSPLLFPSNLHTLWTGRQSWPAARVKREQVSMNSAHPLAAWPDGRQRLRLGHFAEVCRSSNPNEDTLGVAWLLDSPRKADAAEAVTTLLARRGVGVAVVEE